MDNVKIIRASTLTIRRLGPSGSLIRAKKTRERIRAVRARRIRDFFGARGML
jgi:hypothetical protein